MNKESKIDSCAFDLLFSRNVPHILEKIFFSLDYASFQNFFKVNKTWNAALSSQSCQKKSHKMLLAKQENEKKLWQASRYGDVDSEKLIISSGGWMDADGVFGQHKSTPLMEAARWGDGCRGTT